VVSSSPEFRAWNYRVLRLSRAVSIDAKMAFFTRFLLKYVSRDEVELLGRGSNGVVEIRGAISQYTEASPLYGFIRYRRRSILIKYVPEGTSRLVQGKALAIPSSEHSCFRNWRLLIFKSKSTGNCPFPSHHRAIFTARYSIPNHST
jgi:hypothetical protein